MRNHREKAQGKRVKFKETPKDLDTNTRIHKLKKKQLQEESVEDDVLIERCYLCEEYVNDKDGKYIYDQDSSDDDTELLLFMCLKCLQKE